MGKNYYLSRFREILHDKGLDAIVTYANSYDDRFLKVLTGTSATLQCHVLFTQNHLYLSLPRYLIASVRCKTTAKLLAAEGEKKTGIEIAKKLGKAKKIGVLGQYPHLDLDMLNPLSVVDLTDEGNRILSFKHDWYITKLQYFARKLSTIMDSAKIVPGENQLDASRFLHKKIIENDCELAFPICITSGKDLLESTAMAPQNKKIRQMDIICVDMGLKKDIFTTDRTRMYFTNYPEAEKLYNEIKKQHKMIIQTVVNPSIKFSGIIDEYKERLERYSLVKTVERLDFGHGIGFALHEYPNVEEEKGRVGRNIVFTLEPTVLTKFGKMRIEDMIAINSTGKVINLTL